MMWFRKYTEGTASPVLDGSFSFDRSFPMADIRAVVDPDLVSQMFPAVVPKTRFQKYLPSILAGIEEFDLTTFDMVLMALATIRAETEGFVPLTEGISKYNTSPGGHPFNLYDDRHDIGNTGYPDGQRFCGRGFIQLTGRSNYARIGSVLGMGSALLDNPEKANEPDTAARILAAFLSEAREPIEQYLRSDLLGKARRKVNGGSHGRERFSDAFVAGRKAVRNRLGQ